MVPISLLKKPSFNLAKTPNINLSKSPNIDLSKLAVITLNQKDNFSPSTLQPKTNSPGGNWDLPQFTEPLPGLVPISGTNIYINPSTPADPTDCDLYPNSPYCGGNPFVLKPIGIDIELVLDKCNLGISITPVLGFIKLPSTQLVLKDINNPDCLYNPPPPAPKLPPESVFTPNAFPTKAGCWYAVWIESAHDNPDDPTSIHEVGAFGVVTGVSATKTQILAQDPGDATAENSYYLHCKELGVPGRFDMVLNSDGSHSYIQKSIQQHEVDYYLNLPFSHNNNDRYHFDYNYGATTSNTGVAIPTTAKIIECVELYCVPSYKLNVSLPPLPPKFPPPPDDMNCCPALLGLLKVLLVRVDELDAKVEACNAAIGVEEFPANLPKRLIYPNAKGNEKIENLVQAIGYQVKQIDKAVGYLPQKIKVLDTNSALAGNQSVEVEIHSFADFAKETLQYLIDTEGDDDTLTNLAVRILYECGAIHQLSVQTAAMVDAAIEHLDFKESWKTVEVPFAYDPYAGQKGKKAGEGFGTTPSKPLPLTEEELEKLMPDLLKETLVKIKVLINTQKRTLNDLMQELLRDTRIAAAGVSENASSKRLVEIVEAAQAALQLQNTIARNNVRKALTSGDLRTRKKPK